MCKVQSREICSVPIVCLVILFNGLFRGSLAKKDLLPLCFCAAYWTISQLFLAYNSYIECLDVSVFFFPTASHLLLCAAGQASQGLGQKRIARSRKTSDAAFPSLPCSLRGFRDPGSELESKSGIFEFLQNSVLCASFPKCTITSLQRNLRTFFDPGNDIFASGASEKRAIRKWEWGFP